MEEQFKPIEVEISFVKTDPEILKKLFVRLKKDGCNGCSNPYTSEKQVKTLMRYNVWTVDQFCDVSRLKVSTVSNMARPAYINGEFALKVDYCFPFPDSNGRGPKYIVRNAKSEKYIKF